MQGLVAKSPWYYALPMWLTWARVFAIPLFVAVYYIPFEHHIGWATFIFGVAAFTDFVDGYLARLWNVQSKLGAFLDPVADKLLVGAALVILAVHYQDMVITLAMMVILIREIYISALREWMASLNVSGLVAVSWVGKFKTAAQLAAMDWLIYGDELWGIDWYFWGYWLLLVSAFLTLWSMVEYTKASLPYLR